MGKMLALATIWTMPFGLFGLARSAWSTGPAVATAVLGVIGTGIAFAFMATLVGRVGGPRAAFVTYLIPVVSLVLGVVFLDERVHVGALFGVALVIGGAVMACRREA
jgi:drug/metabolite transporter (DMT)-like permease